MPDDALPIPGAAALLSQQPTPPTPEVPPAEQAEGEGEEEEPKYVTEEQLAQLENRIVKRVAQSASDRVKRTEAEVKRLKGLVEKTGLQVSPQQEAQLRTAIEEAGGTEPGTPEVPDVADEDAQYLANEMRNAFATVGATVERTDPEWAVIDAALRDPKGSTGKFVLACAAAAGTKKQRLTSNQSNASLRSPGGAGAGPAGQAPAASASDYWKKAYGE